MDPLTQEISETLKRIESIMLDMSKNTDYQLRRIATRLEEMNR